MYHGMEREPQFDPANLYYGGAGSFYNPQMQRGITQTSAQGTSGPGGGPGPEQASLPAVGSSSSDAFDPGRRLEVAGQSVGVGGSAGLTVLSAGPETAPVALLVAVGAAFGYSTAMFFEDLFGGGSPDYPPNYWTLQFRLDRAGRHPLYDQMLGIAPELTPAEASTDGSLPTKDEDIEPSSGATVALVGALEIAADAETFGGGPEDPIADVMAVAALAVGGAYAIYEEFQFYSKGGKQNIRDTGLAGLDTADLEKLARSPSVPPQERRRYQRELKARKQRNRRKRRQ